MESLIVPDKIFTLWNFKKDKQCENFLKITEDNKLIIWALLFDFLPFITSYGVLKMVFLEKVMSELFNKVDFS